MKSYIHHETNKSIREMRDYLTSIYSYEAKGFDSWSEPRPSKETLVNSLKESLEVIGFEDETFNSTGNFTALIERYHFLLTKYNDPANNVGLRSDSEHAKYLMCLFIRGLLRPLDYISTFITTGEFKAARHEADVESGGELAYIQLPTFEGLNKFSLFVSEVEALVPPLQSSLELR